MRKKKKKKIIIILLAILFAVVVIAGLAFMTVYSDISGSARSNKEIVFTVEEGTAAVDIAKQLGDIGAVKYPTVFRIYAKLKGYESQFSYGDYVIPGDLSYDEIAYELINNGKKAATARVTIHSRDSIDDIAVALEQAGVCKTEDFINEVQNGKFDYDFVKQIPNDKVHYRLEGYLFPETYRFYTEYSSKECAHMAVERMLAETDKALDTVKEDIEKSNYSLHEIMTMASLVELESSGSEENMAKVSALFYNRLERPDFSTLGCSPTIGYPYGNGAYNTYTTPGLPPGPLCAISAAALKGAANPEKDFDYVYFVTDKNGEFYFNKTYADHQAIIAKLKKENNWIYEQY